MSNEADKLDGFRQRRMCSSRNTPNSPLNDEQKAAFEHLNYFPDNPGPSTAPRARYLSAKASARSHDPAPSVARPSTTPALAGHFEAEGKPDALSIFREQTRGHLFVPFRDETSGKETYEVGRYLEPKLLPDGKVNLDLTSPTTRTAPTTTDGPARSHRSRTSSRHRSVLGKHFQPPPTVNEPDTRSLRKTTKPKQRKQEQPIGCSRFP